MSGGGLRHEATEVEHEVEDRLDGVRSLAERVAGRLGGNPGVARLQAVMRTYDRAGGGLVAGGLAYTSLLALLPGLLLALSVVGLLISDPAVQRRIVVTIADVMPPFKDLATSAFKQVSVGAVPSGILALATLLWGSSRFYANIDTAFSRIFSGAPRRNALVQTIRGILLTIALVLVPIALVFLGSLVSWVTQLTSAGASLSAIWTFVLQIVSPIASVAAFGVVVAVAYRFVPSERVSWRALSVPAGAAGLVLALLTQVYAFIAPRLVGTAAIYGTFVAVFALLAWLSIAFNVLLLGAAWTEVRMRMGPYIALPLGGDAGGAKPGASAAGPEAATNGRSGDG
jgi:membrane protein